MVCRLLFGWPSFVSCLKVYGELVPEIRNWTFGARPSALSTKPLVWGCYRLRIISDNKDSRLLKSKILPNRGSSFLLSPVKQTVLVQIFPVILLRNPITHPCLAHMASSTREPVSSHLQEVRISLLYIQIVIIHKTDKDDSIRKWSELLMRRTSNHIV